MPAQLTTDLMPIMVSTSVMLRLSQRLMLMPTTLVPTDLEDSLPTVDLDTQPTTHMPMAPTHTGPTTDTLATLDTDISTKLWREL